MFPTTGLSFLITGKRLERCLRIRDSILNDVTAFYAESHMDNDSFYVENHVDNDECDYSEGILSRSAVASRKDPSPSCCAPSKPMVTKSSC